MVAVCESEGRAKDGRRLSKQLVLKFGAKAVLVLEMGKFCPPPPHSEVCSPLMPVNYPLIPHLLLH